LVSSPISSSFNRDAARVVAAADVRVDEAALEGGMLAAAIGADCFAAVLDPPAAIFF
jgi:hypothetical protein